jgi:hypothetical protein
LQGNLQFLLLLSDLLLYLCFLGWALDCCFHQVLLSCLLQWRVLGSGCQTCYWSLRRLNRWYVQNVSTFPNTFAIVSPLICVFWIQLTRTNTVFSRIALVSCFCAEIRLSGKTLENIAKILFYQKTHRARRGDEERQGAGLTTRGRGLALAAPTCGEASLAVASTPPSAYIYPLTWKKRGFSVFPR